MWSTVDIFRIQFNLNDTWMMITCSSNNQTILFFFQFWKLFEGFAAGGSALIHQRREFACCVTAQQLDTHRTSISPNYISSVCVGRSLVSCRVAVFLTNADASSSSYTTTSWYCHVFWFWFFATWWSLFSGERFWFSLFGGTLLVAMPDNCWFAQVSQWRAFSSASWQQPATNDFVGLRGVGVDYPWFSPLPTPHVHLPPTVSMALSYYQRAIKLQMSPCVRNLCIGGVCRLSHVVSVPSW